MEREALVLAGFPQLASLPQSQGLGLPSFRGLDSLRKGDWTSCLCLGQEERERTERLKTPWEGWRVDSRNNFPSEHCHGVG